MSPALAGKGPGPVDGGSAFYSDSARPYRTQAEQGMELELEYDEHSLDELEQWFLVETIELTKDQNKEEDKECTTLQGLLLYLIFCMEIGTPV